MRATTALSSLVLLFLLTCAPPASAECAWVLWNGDDASDMRSWSREAVFDTRADCVRAIDTKAAKLGLTTPYRGPSAGSLNERGWRASETVLDKHAPSEARWQCLPDTARGSAAPAAAACAWILWDGVAAVDAEPGGSMKKAIGIDAFESSAACIGELDAQEARMRRLYFGVNRSSSTALIVSTSTYVDKMECLPDTVDPRGAKGGTR